MVSGEMSSPYAAPNPDYAARDNHLRPGRPWVPMARWGFDQADRPRIDFDGLVRFPPRAEHPGTRQAVPCCFALVLPAAKGSNCAVH